MGFGCGPSGRRWCGCAWAGPVGCWSGWASLRAAALPSPTLAARHRSPRPSVYRVSYLVTGWPLCSVVLCLPFLFPHPRWPPAVAPVTPRSYVRCSLAQLPAAASGRDRLSAVLTPGRRRRVLGDLRRGTCFRGRGCGWCLPGGGGAAPFRWLSRAEPLRLSTCRNRPAHGLGSLDVGFVWIVSWLPAHKSQAEDWSRWPVRPFHVKRHALLRQVLGCFGRVVADTEEATDGAVLPQAQDAIDER